MVVDEIRAQLRSIPELGAWPDLVRLVERPTAASARPCWEYPLFACRAVGGRAEQALPGAGAIFCLLYSIHLVDDLLDQDPQGLYRQVGEGKAANFALALQAAAGLLIDRTSLPPERRSAIHASIAQIAFATAYGQDLDSSDVQGEAGYWRVVESKTPPLFKGAFFIGALLGGASIETACSVAEIGFELGKSIQISDDLKDAMEKPAKTDWHQQSNNLPILYALTADHGNRERFLDLLPLVEEPQSLAEAQDILVKSGAVSYCVYHITELHKKARERLQEIPLADPEPLATLLDYHLEPVKRLFTLPGVESPEGLRS